MTYYTTKLHAPRNMYEEALLNLVATSEIIRKIGDRLFSQYGLTRAQFNILVLVREGGEAGLTQVEIGREMIVTASNISSHMDRLEKMGLIVREQRDRRTNGIRLTPKAQALLDEVLAALSRSVQMLILIENVFIVKEKEIRTILLLVPTAESVKVLADSLQQVEKAYGRR